MEKRCIRCKETKDLEAFNKNKQELDGHAVYCRACRSIMRAGGYEYHIGKERGLKSSSKEQKRLYMVKCLYGLDAEAYTALRLRWNDTCGICGKPTTDVDHNHVTGKVRGLLCGPCNRGLGMFQDNPTLLRNAETYLARTSI